MKKNTLSLLITLVILYLFSAITLLRSAPANKSFDINAFNPLEQMNSWLFVSVWSLGYWGILVLLALFAIIFIVVRWIVVKFKLAKA